MTTHDRPLRRRLETIVLIVLLVFSVAQSAYYNRVDEQRQEHEQEQVQRNSLENDCQTAYAVALTDALQDRDTVAVLARSASVDLWRTFRDLLVNPLPGNQGRERFLDALNVYLRTLKQVSKTADINPYPGLAECFEQIDEKVADELAIRLASATFAPRYHGRCRGKPVTIQGTKHGDVITGTDGRDVIRSGRGVDLVSSGAGRDRICAGNAKDFINAGRGFDRVNCGKGLDSVQQEERRRNCEL